MIPEVTEVFRLTAEQAVLGLCAAAMIAVCVLAVCVVRKVRGSAGQAS